MTITNIKWDVDINQVLENMTLEEMEIYGFILSQDGVTDYLGLPETVTLPDDMEDDLPTINEYLYHEYGYKAVNYEVRNSEN